MKSKALRRILLTALTAVMLAGVPGTVQAAESIGEESQVPSHYSGNNVEKQNYSRWSSPMSSYLEPLSDGRFMRVQYTDNGEVLVEYYDGDLHLSDTRIIPQELPLFGGFYASDTHYYLLTGQSNLEESPKVEVFRVTKYDRNWKRISSVGLYDCNTTRPFEAGSARMDMSGKYLMIRTAHEMYRASDGLNHQANVTMQIDTEQMKITDSYTEMMNSNYGYVSHSFNQFIELENNHIIAVDHGDAYPRSIALLKYPTDISQGKFVPSYPSQCDVIDVIEFPGAIGNNTTGASVGGFEISDSAYLVAGNSVVQDGQSLTRRTRNIFVASVDKQTNGVSIKWLTNYAEGTETTSTPQMVAINKNRYMVLWSKQGEVCYTLVDGNGNQIGKTYTMEGNLSDCAPVVADGKVMWYVWNEEWLNFYQIDIQDISQHSVKERLYGHEAGEPKVTDGILGFDCRHCNTTLPYQSIIQDYNISWGGQWVAEYADPFWRHNSRKVGDKISCSFVPTAVSNESYTCNSDIEVLINNPQIISWTEESRYQDRTYGTLTMLSPGQATVTIRPKWNPSLEKKYVFTVKNAAAYEIEEQISTNFLYYLNGTGASVYRYVGNSEKKFSLTIPERLDGYKVTAIHEDFLFGNSKVTAVTIPNTVTSIGNNAFNSCTSLNTLHIPASVTSIGEFAFTNDNALTAFTCSPDNKAYCIVDGVLYNKARTKLISCPQAASVKIPNTVKSIGDYAFYWNQQLKSVTLPDSVTTVGEGAFAYTNISEVLFPNSVTSIGDFALHETQAKVICNSNSTAHNYAKENAIPFVLLDDTGEAGGSEETGGTQEKKSGLHNDNGTWRYYVNGKVDTTYTGLCQYGGGWYYVQKGVVNFSATGLCQYGKDWYFVQNGAVNFKATGLWNQFGSWWYVENGKVNFKATGLCEYGGGWYFVQNGAVNFKATGLWNQFGSWWFIQNGAVNLKATGLWNQFGSWWYVQKGAVNFKATGLWNQFGSWWYVENGAVNFKYNGQVPYGNAYYNVVNGRVVF